MVIIARLKQQCLPKRKVKIKRRKQTLFVSHPGFVSYALAAATPPRAFFFFPTEYTFLCFKATDRVLAIVRPEAVEELDRLGQVLIVVAVVAQEGNLLVEAVEEVVMYVPSHDRIRPSGGTAQPCGLL